MTAHEIGLVTMAHWKSSLANKKIVIGEHEDRIDYSFLVGVSLVGVIAFLYARK